MHWMQTVNVVLYTSCCCSEDWRTRESQHGSFIEWHQQKTRDYSNMWRIERGYSDQLSTTSNYPHTVIGVASFSFIYSNLVHGIPVANGSLGWDGNRCKRGLKKICVRDPYSENIFQNFLSKMAGFRALWTDMGQLQMYYCSSVVINYILIMYLWL